MERDRAQVKESDCGSGTLHSRFEDGAHIDIKSLNDSSQCTLLRTLGAITRDTLYRSHIGDEGWQWFPIETFE